ncbi:hypothetical protein BDA96_05G123700 [Sorghum bicolor]|uniref:Uncharacterized protein n=2 Tax=Sorghum bicolor TaxID=4558 RepID=A0A921QWY1_SORBI|nr:hypothetical protein BDA96_05G123700 [Sorghum bicolor]KXG28341.1 hypothetical protein SORBI_3005G112500 [Sorghum bicolor]
MLLLGDHVCAPGCAPTAARESRCEAGSGSARSCQDLKSRHLCVRLLGSHGAPPPCHAANSVSMVKVSQSATAKCSAARASEAHQVSLVIDWVHGGGYRKAVGGGGGSGSCAVVGPLLNTAALQAPMGDRRHGHAYGGPLQVQEGSTGTWKGFISGP